MNKSNSWLIVGVIVVITMASVSAEIHRARNAPTIQYRLRKPHAGQIPRRVSQNEDSAVDPSNSWSLWMEEKVWGHSRTVWILSAISSGLVGVTGIIPLLVIPTNCGFNINSEVCSNRMKGLLSFAVGGLLGDVFLHLLPEAWAHVSDYEDKLSGYRSMGLWFLGGLLSFYFVEKLFGGGEEEEEEGKEDEEEIVMECEEGREDESLESSSDTDEKMRFSKLIRRERKESKTSLNEVRSRKASKTAIADDNASFKATKALDNQKEENMCINGEVSLLETSGGGVQDGDEEDVKEVKDEFKKPDKIKVSGWLNLLANIVDNFTHGLAVAGSYCVSPKIGMLTTFAILLHEVPHEIGDFAILLRAGFDRWKAAKAQLLTATGGIIGAMIALSAESVKVAGDSTAWILPFTAGGFVNIALVTIVPDLVKETVAGQAVKQLALLGAGILVMGLVTALVE